ncbi:MAG TPA: hypothetical protein VI953_01445 [Candidatus Paceibacterota bacterium]
MDKNVRTIRKLLAAGFGGIIGSFVAPSYVNWMEAFILTSFTIGIVFFPRELVAGMREGLWEVWQLTLALAKFARVGAKAAKADIRKEWSDFVTWLKNLPATIWGIATNTTVGEVAVAMLSFLSAVVVSLGVSVCGVVATGGNDEGALIVAGGILGLGLACIPLGLFCNKGNRLVPFTRLPALTGDSVAMSGGKRLSYYLWAIFWWPTSLVFVAIAAGLITLGLAAIIPAGLLKLSRLDAYVSTLAYGTLGIAVGFFAGTPFYGLLAGLAAGGVAIILEKLVADTILYAGRKLLWAVPVVIRY